MGLTHWATILQSEFESQLHSRIMSVLVWCVEFIVSDIFHYFCLYHTCMS